MEGMDCKGRDPDRPARTKAADFLSYCDQTGRVADFHVFRHTYITNLVLSHG